MIGYEVRSGVLRRGAVSSSELLAHVARIQFIEAFSQLSASTTATPCTAPCPPLLRGLRIPGLDGDIRSAPDLGLLEPCHSAPSKSRSMLPLKFVNNCVTGFHNYQ